MKRILALFCLALAVAPPGAQAAATRGFAGDLSGGLKLGGISVAFDAGGQDRHKRRDGGGDNGQRQNDFNRREDDNGGGGREERGDNRMDRAYAIASRYGRVQDVWPKGGPMFGANVSTDRGRIELEINVNSGSAREVNSR